MQIYPRCISVGRLLEEEWVHSIRSGAPSTPRWVEQNPQPVLERVTDSLNPCPAFWVVPGVGGRTWEGGEAGLYLRTFFPFLPLLYSLHLGNVATGTAMALHYQAFITVSCKDLEHFKWFYKKLG